MATIQRIIGVTSCKGGVGKSTVAFNLARRLAAKGHSVGVFDADVHGPSLPTQAEPGASVAPSLANPDVMVPVESGGMKLMSFGFIQGLWSAGDAIDTRGGGAAGELAVQLLHTTKWGALDYLVIDTPPGTGEIPRALAARAHYAGAVVVTTPSDLAVADVVRGVALLRKFDVPILGVVENMATFQCGCGEVHRPFGTGAVDEVLEAIGGGGGAVPAFALPIVADGGLAEAALDGLVEAVASEPPKPVSLPQLDWHEKPSWPDKLFFAARGHDRRHAEDAAFRITPPRYDRQR